jgi:hypothetical protein
MEDLFVEVAGEKSWRDCTLQIRRGEDIRNNFIRSD